MSIRAKLVEVCIMIRKSYFAGPAVASIFNHDRSQCFAITKIGPRVFLPALLPNADRFENLVILRFLERVIHLMFKVVGNALQVEAIFWKQVVVTRRVD